MNITLLLSLSLQLSVCLRQSTLYILSPSKLPCSFSFPVTFLFVSVSFFSIVYPFVSITSQLLFQSMSVAWTFSRSIPPLYSLSPCLYLYCRSSFHCLIPAFRLTATLGAVWSIARRYAHSLYPFPPSLRVSLSLSLLLCLSPFISLSLHFSLLTVLPSALAQLCPSVWHE